MGRKMKLDGNCGSKFITIDDEKKWALIREIATVDRYKNSFNAIVNDALMFGLPELHRRLFDKVEIDGEKKRSAFRENTARTRCTLNSSDLCAKTLQIRWC